MATFEGLTQIHSEMAEWRHDPHAHPETAFEEGRTAAAVALHLESFGPAVHRGQGRIGAVGNGQGEGGCLPHNPHCDSNDPLLPLGAVYSVSLVEPVMAAKA